MRRYALWLILGGVAVAVFACWLLMRSNPQTHARQSRALATRALAEFLVKSRAGRRALVISNPFVRRSGSSKQIIEAEAAGVRGLKEGFGSQIRMEPPVFPDLKAGLEQNPRAAAIDPETTTPLSYLVAEHAFDTLAQAHPDCDLIVSLVGLPAALDRVECWQTNGPPRFALLLPDLRIIGDAEAVRAALKRGKLAAFILARPGAPEAEAEVGPNLAAEFEKRFLLVTPDNIDQLLQTYPKLFPGN